MNNVYKNGERYLDDIQNKKVLVVGDLMIDQYIWGDVSRMSPEAPVPVVGVNQETLRLGGAANVANKILSLGGKVEVCGLVGDDQMGRWLVQDLKKRDIGARGIILSQDRPTTVKTRVIAHSQQVVRVDREVTNLLSRDEERTISGSIRSFLNDCGAMVISDYAKGTITPTLIREIVNMADEVKMPVAVDPKVKHFATYRGVTVLTPNLLEAAAGSGIIIDSMDALIESGREIIRKLDCKFLIITRGDQGMTLFKGGDEWVHIPAIGREVYDVTGAGDTVVATLALGLASGLDMEDSAWLANIAAGVVISEVGTVPITLDQMKDRVRELGKTGL
jgi:D-beta-D-heptose 7-phosphate kinase/D-beta-D-heptose 1-phosphate adenosyltransferase